MAVLAGIVAGANEPFLDTTQAQYVRLSGTIAILAFAVGYDPSFLRNFLNLLPKPAGASPAPDAPAGMA